jgi:uncharacterized protein YndB with AHSA1/START domain
MSDFAKRLDEHTVQFVRILPGPTERVWDYLWDSKKRGEWFASGAMPTTVGESFEMHFKHSELSPHTAAPPDRMAEMDRTGHTSRNTLLAYEPPHRLFFTFGPEKRIYSEVEFRLDPEGDPKDNKVCFTLTHSKIPTASLPSMCPAAGTPISPSWKNARMAAPRPPSGMCGAAMMAFTTGATPSAGAKNC